MTSDPMARRDVDKLNNAESLMREVLFAPEVNRWWPEAVPQLLLALDFLDLARKHLGVHVEVKDA